MRRRMRRHLVLQLEGPALAAGKAAKPAELTWPDFLVMLLHVAAEIEHGLMVEYLYAAYSLGGDQVPPKHRRMVQRWRDSILAVAREEMGHLLSVQNILCLLGAPINLDREDYPWDAPYYPFPFALEPLTRDSLSCYVFAEMPPSREFKGKKLPRRYQEFVSEDLPRIRKVVKRRTRPGAGHTVGAVYRTIIDLLGNRDLIPDSAFHADTLSFQASWDDWGRGYGPAPRALDVEGDPEPPSAGSTASAHAPLVIVERVATRTQAVAAMREIAAQGEAPQLRVDQAGEPSHFDRFLEIYQEHQRIDGWNPAREIPVNPNTNTEDPDAEGFIRPQRSRNWANLFNVRYRMLLAYLAHTFRLARITPSDRPSVRAATMHRVFGEMYNLKTIAGILVRLPFRDPADGKRGGKAPRWAGPPFEMPYSLALPPAEADCWRMHQDLLAISDDLCRTLLVDADPDGERYLKTLRDLDRQSMAWLDQVLAGPRSAER